MRYSTWEQPNRREAWGQAWGRGERPCSPKAQEFHILTYPEASWHCLVFLLLCAWGVSITIRLIKLMTFGNRGVCLHLEGQELGRKFLQVPAVVPHQMPGSMAGSSPCLLRTLHLNSVCPRGACSWQQNGLLSPFEVLFFSSFLFPVSGTKDKTKYNRTRSCCSYCLAKQGSFKSSGQQPGPTTKYVFLIISQYRTGQNLNLLKAKAWMWSRFCFIQICVNVPPLKEDHIYP